MTAQDVINLAKNAELKQLAVRTDDSAVLGFINLGLLELYKRFPLKEAEAIITLRDGKTTYKLDGTDPDVSIDSDKELLIITGAYTTSDDGFVEEMTMNDEDDIMGINTPSYNTVEIPATAEGVLVSIIYRATPKFITSVDDLLPLPPQLLEALLNYVGYRGHGSVSGELNAENQSHYVRFENSCKRVILEGLITSDDLVSKKFKNRGFV